MPPPDWPLGKPVGYFINKWWERVQLTSGAATHGQVGMDGIKYQVENLEEQASEKHSSMDSASGPTFMFLSQISLVMEYDVELWAKINPFQPKLLAHGVSSQ